MEKNKTKEWNEYPFTPQSKTLNTFLNRLDDKILSLEDEIDFQKAEAEKWRNEFMTLQQQQLKEGQKMVGDVFRAIFSPTVDILNPASATILVHIRDNCHTIEEVKAYINDMVQRTKDGKLLIEKQ